MLLHINLFLVLQGVNSVELAMDAITHIQKRFYQDYPPHPSEPEYKFLGPSTMKPTQIKVITTLLQVANLPHVTVKQLVKKLHKRAPHY